MSGFWTIDKSMGESRFSQLLGFVVMLGLAVFAVYHKPIIAYFGG